jgi:hypothetical protein
MVLQIEEFLFPISTSCFSPLTLSAGVSLVVFLVSPLPFPLVSFRCLVNVFFNGVGVVVVDFGSSPICCASFGIVNF